MVQTIQASKITIGYLIDKFDLQRVNDDKFFTEWLADLPELSELEKQTLDRIKSNFIHLIERQQMIESIVKMVVLSPLLELAGFYQPPFEIDGEKGVEIFVEDEDEVIKGDIDVLVLGNHLWIFVIESKRSSLSLDAGIPQALAYMLGNPNHEKPCFGFVTNGSHFVFLKLIKQDTPQYGRSDDFSIFNRGNDLYRVFSILKHLAALVQ